MSKEAKDTLAVLSYHSSSSDPFYTSECNTRKSYYSLVGYPTTWCDGVIKREGAYSYSTYRADFNTRKSISSPLRIELTGSYNESTNNGNLNAHITNMSYSTVSGTLQFVLTETDKAYAWQTEDSLFHIVRDMIPDASGEAVSIPGSGTIDKSRNFTVNASWNENKCDIVVFVQGSSKEIYQAAEIHIMDISVEEAYEITDSRLQIYPNPFSHTTVIRVRGSCSSPHDIPPRITIHDLAGRVVKIFNHLTNLSFNQIIWDGRDEAGEKVASGIYFCVLEAGNSKVITKLILAR